MKKDLHSSSMHRILQKIPNIERSCKEIEKTLSNLLLFDPSPKINTILVFLDDWLRQRVT
jgi:hypothetical protein